MSQGPYRGRGRPHTSRGGYAPNQRGRPSGLNYGNVEALGHQPHTSRGGYAPNQRGRPSGLNYGNVEALGHQPGSSRGGQQQSNRGGRPGLNYGSERGRQHRPNEPREDQQQRGYSHHDSTRNNSQNNSGRQPRSRESGEIRPTSYRVLETWVNDEEISPRDLATRLSTDSSGFYLCLNQEMKAGLVQMILQVYAKMSRDDLGGQSLIAVLQHALTSKFYYKVIDFIHGLSEEAARRTVSNGGSHISNCLCLMKTWLRVIPKSSTKAVSMLKVIIDDAAVKLQLMQNEEIVADLDEIQQMIDERKEVQAPGTREQRQSEFENRMQKLHEANPPDNFRNIPVFPQLNDINTDKDPFVRQNLTSSSYRDRDHYLDVQFRLLREDFVRPLRKGIQEYFNNDVAANQKRGRPQSVKVYHNVKIEYPVPAQKGMLHCIHFDPTPFQKIRWQNTKRLMYGNLICLSHDNFKNHLLFGTIADRDADKLALGYLCVEFVHSTNERQLEEEAPVRIQHENPLLDDDDPLIRIMGGFVEEEHEVLEEEAEIAMEAGRTFTIPEVDMKREYTMVETEAYFEAYRHVLAGLQEIERIPLDRYLLHCQKDVRPPRYLTTSIDASNFDFNCVLEDHRATKVNVLKPKDWPSAAQLGIDGSQRAALMDAVTKELAIIQGPPGTGKTFVGLRIMRLLLKNRVKNAVPVPAPRRVPGARGAAIRARPQNPTNPILVVCYTNHALDQFLEGISEFHPHGIVRVGGRCKTESLKQYSLNFVKRNSNHLTAFQRKSIWQIRDELKMGQATMARNSEILEASTSTLLNLKTLHPVIPKHLLHQLEWDSSNPGDATFLEWLGMEDNKLEIDPTILAQEAFGAVCHEMRQRGFADPLTINGIIATESLAPLHLINWIMDNDYMLPNPTLHAEIILDCLAKLELEKGLLKHLKRRGFSKLEIKCAYVVNGRSSDPDVLHQWLESKRFHAQSGLPGQFAQLQVSEDTQGKNAAEEYLIEEESTFIQDRRILDTDDVFRKYDDPKKKKRYNQGVSAEISAITFDELDGRERHPDTQEEWQEVQGSKRKLKEKLQKEIGKTDAMTSREAEGVKFLDELDGKQRWRLYRRWVDDYRSSLREEINRRTDQYCQTAKKLQQIQRDEDRTVLEHADIIGITTTGAAKYRDIIHKLPVKVVIVEEAAEVLEAHIVTSMPASTEHLILIGDHQQLKPSPTVYELARNYNLDVSLFERMINNKAPFTRLNIQHRMRPEIANLLRLDIYDNLIDHQSVLEYEQVSGVEKNVFFITHEVMEESVADGRSKSNQHEADFMVSLCEYLMHQGYKPEQITILAAYTGQLFAFKRTMRQQLHQGVRVTAVDNFQGEENDIILLSLVRSNEEAKIGFLSIKNRVCVALSRAKKGLYCIGNFNILQQSSELWKKIVCSLKADGLFGTSIALQCQNHPKCITQASTVADFKKVPDGGCGKPCEYRLGCGHVCTRSCHPDDQDHTKFTCRKPCTEKCPKEHQCKKRCYEVCGRCTVQVEKMVPKCCHMQKMNCSQDPKSYLCKKPCPETLTCGHKCASTCGGKCTSECNVPCKVLSPCGHEIFMACYLSKNPDKNLCNEKCNETLKCGHVCKGTCSDCFQGRLHIRCQQKCDRLLVCGHICKAKCAQNCPPCGEKCETICKHSKCKLKCCQPCTSCSEKCDWKCEHVTCKSKCGEPCDRPPCNKPCEKLIEKCKHPCIGLCGEPCPELCRICDKEKVTEIFFGDEDEEEARFVELENCRHIFTYEELDTWMNQKDDSEDQDIKLKKCPRCNTYIRRSTRYRKIINEQLKLINQVKSKIAGDKYEIQDAREKLRREMNSDKAFRKVFSKAFDILTEEVHESRAKTLTAVHNVSVKYQGLSSIAKSTEITQKNHKSRASIFTRYETPSYPPEVSREFGKCEKKVRDWLMRRRENFSDQEVDDLQMELERLKQAANYFVLKHAAKTAGSTSATKLLDKLGKILIENCAPFDEKKQKAVEQILHGIKETAPELYSGLGISVKEKEMIVKAMGMSKGHWYKCPKGHVYAIGDCGGATVESKCPECNSVIGGTSHQLSAGNQLAREMDGAARPAYDPMNFHIPEDLM